MADSSAPTASIETRDDLGEGPDADFLFWNQQIKLGENKAFEERGRTIVKRYRDERAVRDAGTTQEARFNILWANVETLKPILYGRTPKPDVERRHKNGDDVARMGADIIERALSYEDDLDEFDKVMVQVVEDRLLPGRGVARVFYEAEYGVAEPDPDAGEDGDDDTGEGPTRPVVGERAPVKYVYWCDYRESPARTQEEVWWKAYRSYLTRDELVERFEAVGKDVPLDYTPKGMDDDDGPMADAFKKAQVWEIWDKRNKETVWMAPSYPNGLLDKKPDPLELPEFFPSPRPLVATTTNDTTVPVADYVEYQDQAIELDVLTARIDRLTQALKVAGVYAGSQKAELSRMLTSNENILIPVEEWASFMDKGGLQNMIQYLPIDQIAAVLIRLYDARDRVQRTLYQITGMSDILRGDTDPNETLGAQQLKSQFATRRISMAQKDVARFARDLMRLRGFVMAKHFAPETLSKMTGLPEPMPQLPPPPDQYITPPPPQAQAPAPQLVPPQGMAA